MAKYDVNKSIPSDMKESINSCSAGLGAVGVIGGIAGPHADLMVIAPTWIGMTVKLANQAGHNLDSQTAKKIALTVATGAGAFLGGTKLAGTVLAWLAAPFTGGISLAISAVGNATLNATFTKYYGNAAARYFLQVEKIDNTRVAISVLLAAIGLEFGIGLDTDFDALLNSGDKNIV